MSPRTSHSFSREMHQTYNPNVHSERTDTNIGVVGWALIAGLVTAWDLTQEQTLSNYAHERVSDPRTRALALGMIAVTALHLARPTSLHKYDPISRLGTVVRGYTRG